MTTLMHTWTDVCRYADLAPERGVAALIGATPVAIFRTFDGMVHAIDNRDPFTGQSVLSRGIVGTHGDEPTVASPLFKQAFSLRTGHCLTEPGMRVRVFAVRCRDGVVQVREAGA